LSVLASVLMQGGLLQPGGLGEVLFSLISFALVFGVLSVVFYVAGVVVVGGERTSFRDAFAISVLGTLVLIVCVSVFSVEVAGVLSLAAWMLLVRHYYETGILGSIAVGLVSVVVAVAILFVLNVLLGFSSFLSWWLPFFSGI